MTVSAVTRTRLTHRDFICKGDSAHHPFRAAVKIGLTDDGTQVERTAQFMSMGNGFTSGASWLPLPICPFCGSMSEERDTYNPDTAQVPESQRFVAYLSADGQRLSIPGERDKPMAERYALSGYRRVEASSMRDMDRFEAIRARQTGNEVTSEMQYDVDTRQWHDDAPYDPDDMTSPI